MARILVAFYNCMKDDENPNAMPVFYESFVQGLDRVGNEIAMFSHDLFGVDFGEMDAETKTAILHRISVLCLTIVFMIWQML